MGLDLILEKQSKREQYICYSHKSYLITHWAVVIHIADSHFHHGLCDKEPVGGRDIEEVSVLFFPV